MTQTATNSLFSNAAIGTIDTALATTLDAPGLPTEAFYLYATLRTAAGEPVTVTRRLPVDGGIGLRRLLVRAALDGGTAMQPLQEGREAASSVHAVLRTEGDGLEVASDPAAPGRSFTATITDRRLTWNDSELIELTGIGCGPGLWWSAPGMQYSGWMFQVSGTAMGRAVTGLAGLDRVQLPAGSALYLDDPITATAASKVWTTFATEYDDGAVDFGHIVVGHDDDGFAIVWADSTLTATTTGVSGEVSADRSFATMQVQNTAWQFTAEPGGVWPATDSDPMLRAEGLVHRIDEHRTARTRLGAQEISAARFNG